MSEPPPDPRFPDRPVGNGGRNLALGVGLGCGAVAIALVLCGGIAAFFAYRVVEVAGEVAGEFAGAVLPAIARQQAVMTNWDPPPADAEPADLLPETVGTYRRTAVDRETANPIFGVDLDGGVHGVYTDQNRAGDPADGPRTVQVYVYPADNAEGWATIAAVEGVLQDGARFPNRTVYNLGDMLVFEIAPSDAMPAMSGMLAHRGDWLVFVRSGDDPQVGEFTLALLAAPEMNDPWASVNRRRSESGSLIDADPRTESGSTRAPRPESGSLRGRIEREPGRRDGGTRSPFPRAESGSVDDRDGPTARGVGPSAG